MEEGKKPMRNSNNSRGVCVYVCMCTFFRSCAMLEPIKKEIKTEEKKRRGETRAHCEQKFFDLSLPFR